MRNHQSETTVAFRVYHDGKDYLGTATLEMPEIGYMTETLNGAGLAGEIETPVVGLTQSMTVKMTMTSATHPFFDSLDWTRPALYECYGDLQVADPVTHIRTTKPYRINFLGRLKTETLGSLEMGKKHGNEMEFEVTRLKVYLDGEEKFIHDKLNFIHRVNGNDLLAQTRKNLGLSV